MARKPPKYALHRPSGHARVRINGKDFYLGEYNSKESLEEYDRLLAKYFLGSLDVDRDSLLIACLAISREYARGYYLKDGVQTSEVNAIQMALKPLVKMFGREKIHSFGPRKLGMVRESMIQLKWARTTCQWARQNQPLMGASKPAEVWMFSKWSEAAFEVSKNCCEPVF